MSDVRMDLDRLESAAGTARTLALTFDDAESFADDLGALTGHGGLADKIEDFGGKWDIAREELRENLRSQADFMQAIVDTFRDLDNAMAQEDGA
jgi:ABC-type transporter Mla subunit MlaD